MKESLVNPVVQSLPLLDLEFIKPNHAHRPWLSLTKRVNFGFVYVSEAADVPIGADFFSVAYPTEIIMYPPKLWVYCSQIFILQIPKSWGNSVC